MMAMAGRRVFKGRGDMRGHWLHTYTLLCVNNIYHRPAFAQISKPDLFPMTRNWSYTHVTPSMKITHELNNAWLITPSILETLHSQIAASVTMKWSQIRTEKVVESFKQKWSTLLSGQTMASHLKSHQCLTCTCPQLQFFAFRFSPITTAHFCPSKWLTRQC
jgi:hypothetical protein